MIIKKERLTSEKLKNLNEHQRDVLVAWVAEKLKDDDRIRFLRFPKERQQCLLEDIVKNNEVIIEEGIPEEGEIYVPKKK